MKYEGSGLPPTSCSSSAPAGRLEPWHSSWSRRKRPASLSTQQETNKRGRYTQLRARKIIRGLDTTLLLLYLFKGSASKWRYHMCEAYNLANRYE